MTLKRSANLKPIAEKLRTGPKVWYVADSIGTTQPLNSSGEEDTTDSVYYAFLRNWTFTPLELVSTSLFDKDPHVQPDPAVIGVCDVNVLYSKKFGQPDNDWPQGDADTGEGAMSVGVSVYGQTAQNIDLMNVIYQNYDTAFSGLAIESILNSTALSSSIIYHRHSDGGTFQFQHISGATNKSTVINSDGTNALVRVDNDPLDATAGSTQQLRMRQVTGLGDQSGKFNRVIQFALRNGNAVNGIQLWGSGTRGSGWEHWGENIAGGGMFDDSGLDEWLALINADTAIMWLGRNNFTETKAAIKAKVATALTRAYNAGIGHILTIGTYQDGIVTAQQAQDINEAVQEASEEHVGAVVGNISMHAIIGGQISGSYLSGLVHPNGPGADYLLGLAQAELETALASGGSPALRRLPGVGLGLGL
jgi:hypothetical protein